MSLCSFRYASKSSELKQRGYALLNTVRTVQKMKIERRGGRYYFRNRTQEQTLWKSFLVHPSSPFLTLYNTVHIIPNTQSQLYLMVSTHRIQASP
jgi:hypothetical protein